MVALVEDDARLPVREPGQARLPRAATAPRAMVEYRAVGEVDGLAGFRPGASIADVDDPQSAFCVSGVDHPDPISDPKPFEPSRRQRYDRVRFGRWPRFAVGGKPDPRGCDDATEGIA